MALEIIERLAIENYDAVPRKTRRRTIEVKSDCGVGEASPPSVGLLEAVLPEALGVFVVRLDQTEMTRSRAGCAGGRWADSLLRRAQQWERPQEWPRLLPTRTTDEILLGADGGDVSEGLESFFSKRTPSFERP